MRLLSRRMALHLTFVCKQKGCFKLYIRLSNYYAAMFLALFSTHQACRVRTDPDFNADMVSAYSQINTQLEWKPASPLAIISATIAIFGIAGIFFAANIFGGVSLEVVSSSFLLAGFLVAVVTVSIISFQLKQWQWFSGILAIIFISLVAYTFPNAVLQYLIWFIALLLVIVFGFIGPRRERVFIVT